MPEMGDAQLRDLEDEDRVAVALGAAAPVPDVGRNVPHPHVLIRHVMLGRLLVRRPAAQHVFDRRIGTVRVMGRVGMVHRDDVGQDRRPEIVVVVGRDAHAARALDQKRRVANVSQPDLPVGERRDLECRGNDRRAVGGDEPGTAVGEFRGGWRRVLLRRCRRDVGRGADDERADDRKEEPWKPHAVSRGRSREI